MRPLLAGYLVAWASSELLQSSSQEFISRKAFWNVSPSSLEPLLD